MNEICRNKINRLKPTKTNVRRGRMEDRGRNQKILKLTRNLKKIQKIMKEIRILKNRFTHLSQTAIVQVISNSK